MWHIIGFYHGGHCWDLNWGKWRRLQSAPTGEAATKAELLAEQVTSPPPGWAVNGYAVKKGGEWAMQYWLSTEQYRLGWEAKGESENSNRNPACAFFTAPSWWPKSPWPQPSGQGFILRIILNVRSYSWNACSPRVKVCRNLSCVHTALGTAGTSCSVR